MAAGAAIFSGLASVVTLPAKVGMAGLMIAGGALNIAGSALASVNLMGTAALMASGGLHGRGKSGNVKKDEARKSQMVKSSVNKKGPTGQGESRGGASNSLANIKSTLADYNEPEGSMSMLPTGGEDGMGMLSGMLRQIAVNTSYLGGIDSKISALLSLSSVPLIDQAQETKGGGASEAREGVISKSFNSLKSGIGRINSSIGGAIKNVIKGLALFAAFITFKKFEPEITSGLASLFKNVSGFFDTMSAGSDPSEGILGYFDNMMETSILPALTTMAEKALEVIFKGITIALNKVLPKFMQIDEGLENESSGKPGNISKEQKQVNEFVAAGRDLGNITGFKDMYGLNLRLGNRTFGGHGDVGDDEKEYVMKAVRSRLQYMYDVFDATDGRVRWTKIGPGFVKGEGIDSLNGSFSIADILYKSQPIVDGKVKPESILDMPLSVPDLTGDALADYMVRAKQNSRIQQKLMMPRGAFMFDEFQNILMETGIGSTSFEEMEQILKYNEIRLRQLIKDDNASSSNGQGEILASIDASSNSNHMHETNVNGPTPFANLNVAPFMGANISV